MRLYCINVRFTDSLEQRASVRQNLAGDPEWINKFFSKILPWMQKQENSVIRCYPGTDIMYPETKGEFEHLCVIFACKLHLGRFSFI